MIVRPGLHGGQNHLAEIVNVGAARIFGGKFHFLAVLPPEANHFRNLIESLLARHSQLVLEVQVGSGEKNMQAGFGGGFEAAQRRIHVLLGRAGEGCYTATFNFSGYGARRVQVAGRGDREARFENVNPQLLDLPGKLQLFLAIHRKAGRLLAVSQGGVENLQHVHGDSFPTAHTASETRTAQGVQFIMVASRINLAYIRLMQRASLFS